MANVESFLVIYFLLLFFPAKTAFAQVVINEFSSATSDNDWIELYNTIASEVDLKGWSINDTASTPVWELGDSVLIPGHGFCVKDVSGRLNNPGDRVKLFQGSTEKDCVAYGNGNGEFCGSVADIDAPIGGVVVAKKPDGIGTWTFSSPTSGYSNEASSEPGSKLLCYTPPPTSMPSPTDTPTPSITLVPSPASTATPTPVSKATYKINNVKDENGNILHQVKIYVDDNYTKHWVTDTEGNQTLLTFCDGCHCDDEDTVDCGLGQHTIRTEKEGYETWQETRTLNAGDSHEVNPVMEVISPSTPTPTATPVPASTLTPTPTPRLSLTPIKTPTPSKSLTPTPTGGILGEKTASESGLFNLASGGITPIAEETTASKQSIDKKKFIFPALAVILGLGFIGFSVFSFLKGRRQKEEAVV